MTLKETVAEILGRKVMLKEAKDFANNQFGTLCAFIKKAGQSGTDNPYQFGKHKNYKKDDIVVWSGCTPCITKLDGVNNCSTGCFSSCANSHDSMYYGYLRYATPKEIELLGDRDIRIIKGIPKEELGLYEIFLVE